MVFYYFFHYFFIFSLQYEAARQRGRRTEMREMIKNVCEENAATAATLKSFNRNVFGRS